MSLTADGLLLFDDNTMLTSYGTEEEQLATTSILDGKKTLKIVGNSWKKYEIPTYQVTANTILEVYYKSSVQGEIQGIGIDNDDTISPNQIFKFYGTEAYGILDYDNYSVTPLGTWKKYTISLAQYTTGEINYLTFINDQDVAQPTAESSFFNIRLYEKIALARDIFSISEDNPLVTSANRLLNNDIGTNLKVIGVDRPSNGTVTLNNGTIVFTPTANFFGTAGYRYTVVDRNGKKASANVKITVSSVNDAPNAVNDSFTLDQGNSLTIPVAQLLSNDSDVDGDTLTLTGVSQSLNGNVQLSGSNVIFTPLPNFVGQASFNYTVSDVRRATSTARVNITVRSVNRPPNAVDDSFSTTQNDALTLSVAQLLGNDTDPDRNLLTLTKVDQAVNGSVQLSGNTLIFTPVANFEGQASFKYEISDGQGGTDIATVIVNVNGSSGGTNTSSVPLGTNLALLADYSTQLPFIDGFRTARNWIPQNSAIWDTGERSLLNLDANGWVKSLPALADAPQYNYVGTVLYREIQGKYPGGKYIVLYDGEGTLNYSFDARKDTTSSRPGRDVINVTPSGSGIYLSITSTDPNRTGNYIRNIRVVPETYEATYDTQLFNPTFLEKTKPFGALRFMEWMKTNHSTQGKWSDRPTLQDATWSTKGAPVEVMVELANRLDTDPWFTMPHKADDEYVRNFAQYVKEHLEPGRKVYVEFSNEVWNWQFSQTTYADQQAKASGLSSYADWFSKRTTEITRIWDNVFGADKDRVIGVMATQAANSWLGQRELSMSWDTTGKKSYDYYGIDAVAIAPYFGGYLGNPSTSAEVASWTKDQLFRELTVGGVLSTGPAGGALKQSSDWMTQYADLARREGLQLLAYEGGQHLVGHSGAENNLALTTLFTEANKDPRMGELYKQNLAKWYELGGGLFMNYSDVGFASKWGSWGSLEYIDQNGSPKYNAILDVIESLTTSK